MSHLRPLAVRFAVFSALVIAALPVAAVRGWKWG
jgi:hypothetical protein